MRRFNLVVVLNFLVVSIGSNLLADEPQKIQSDAEIRKKLAGTWSCYKPYTNNCLVFSPDGVVMGHVTNSMGGYTDTKGRWFVKEGILYTKGVRTTELGIMKFALHEEIVRLTDNELTVQEPYGLRKVNNQFVKVYNIKKSDLLLTYERVSELDTPTNSTRKGVSPQ